MCKKTYGVKDKYAGLHKVETLLKLPPLPEPVENA